MLVTRWDPFAWSHIGRLQNEMNQLFGRFGLADTTPPTLSYAYPPVNLWEDGDSVHVEAELPGMQLEHLEIYVTEGDQLSIQGERKPSVPENGAWHRQERGYGKFSRVIPLPAPVDADKVEARFEQGVLHITLPRSEAAKPRKITVKAE